MARAVDPWLHRVCIRMYGPNDPWMKLILFTLNSTMDGDTGESFHGLESLAKAASMGVSTVRAKLIEASRQGWVARYERRRTPQGWKSYLYRSCVPDSIDLSTITFTDNDGNAQDGEYLADCHVSRHGEIDDRATAGTLYPQKGKRRAPPAHGGSSSVNQQGVPPADDMKHRQPAAEAPPADSENNRQRLRGKFSDLKFSGLSTQGEGALARTVSVESLEDRIRKATRLLGAQPDISNRNVALMLGLTIEQVQQLRATA